MHDCVAAKVRAVTFNSEMNLVKIPGKKMLSQLASCMLLLPISDFYAHFKAHKQTDRRTDKHGVGNTTYILDRYVCVG